MKKILIVLFAVFLFAGCTSGSKGTFQEIDYRELKDMISEKDTFVLFIMRTGCSHCEEYEPTLKKVINDNELEVFYINLAKLGKANEAALTKKTDLDGTPTLIYVEKGVFKTDNSLVGTTTYENTEDFFKEVNFID